MIVRAATLTTLPDTRVPSLMINVSADEMAAPDTTHKPIAAAVTILFIWYSFWNDDSEVRCGRTADGDDRMRVVRSWCVLDRTRAGRCLYDAARADLYSADVSDSPTAKKFYIVLGVAITLDIGLNYAGLDAIQLLFTTAVINGVLAPPLILIVLLLTSDRTVMDDAVNSLHGRVPGLARIRGDGRGCSRALRRLLTADAESASLTHPRGGAFVLECQQSVKEGTIALQGHPQVFGGHIVALFPLLLQPSPLGREPFRKSLHNRRDQLVSVFDGTTRLIKRIPSERRSIVTGTLPSPSQRTRAASPVVDL